MRLLVVEDSEILRENLTVAFRRRGYAVDASGNGKAALWRLRSVAYDVAVLDIMIPQMDGLAVLRTIRAEGIATPVILLTARVRIDERVDGLRSGADDYLIKPFDFEELLARVEALIRRAHGATSTTICAGLLEIDLAKKRATKNGADLELAPREYNLLELLMLHRGNVVSRTEIEAHIYDERVAPASNVVDSAVAQLRRKIDQPGTASLIETRRGFGYRLADETP